MRFNRSIITASAISAAVAVSGCKKDEPVAPAPAADVAPVAEKAPTPAPETPKQPEPVAEKPPAPAAPTTAPARPAMAMATVPAFPESVIGVAATPSLKALVESLAAFQPSLGGDPFGTVLSLAQRSGEFGDLSKIAWDKPLYVVFPDPTKWQDGFVWAVHTLEGFDPKVTFPGITENAGIFELKTGEQTLSMKMSGTVLHIASHADLLTSMESFLKDSLLAWTPTQPLQAEASIENAMRIYAAEIAEARSTLPMMAKEAEQAGANAAQLKLLVDTANDGIALLEGMTRIGVAFDPTGDFPRIGFSAAFKPDSSGAKFAAQSKDRRTVLAASAPDDAWLVFGSNYDVTLGASTAEELAASISSISDGKFQWTAAEANAIAEQLVKFQGAVGDESAMWLRAAGAMPLIVEAAGAAKDGASWRAALSSLVSLIADKLWATAKAEMGESVGPNGEKLDGDLKSAIAKIGEILKPMGVELTFRSDDKLEGVKLAVDWSKIPADAGGPEAAMVKTILGQGFEVGFGASATQGAMAFGPDAFARIEALSQPLTAGSDSWLKRASERAWGTLALRPAPLLKVLAELPPFADYRSMMLEVPSLPIMVEAIANGDAIQLEIEVPLALLKAANRIGGPITP